MKPALSRNARTMLALCGWIMAALATAPAAQQPSTPAQQPPNPGAAAHYDRMAAARTVFLKNTGGSEVPFNVISRNFEGWGHYILVDSAENADMVIEIQSPDDGSEKKDSGGSKTSVYGGNQQKEQAAPKPSTDMIILTVYDKNKRPMWIGREEPKFAVRHKAADEHLVEAAQKLFTRFHDRVEPPVKP